MRGTPLSPLPAARALIAGAAILAGALPGGRAAAEEVAMAVPRAGLLMPGAEPAGLPRPLAPSVAMEVARIFALQARGAMAEAAARTAALGDGTLEGHILADRYLGRFGTASSQELAGWLARFADHPDAGAVHAALLARLPLGPAGEPRPVRDPALDRSALAAARAGRADAALRQIAHARPIDRRYAAALRGEVARVLFTQGRDAQALRLAEGAMRDGAGAAGFAGGLAAWRLGRADLAQPLFEAAAQARPGAAAMHAGAAYWAARAHLRRHDAAGSAAWMRQAAGYPRVFYGMLARRALGGHETLGPADTDAVLATPQGRRAFALLQVGQGARAEAELELLLAQAVADPALHGAVLRVLSAAGLEGAGAPLPPLRPAGGFRVDPPLVYALARLESNFDARAVSGAGARGLMQIMPGTARSIGSTRDAGRLHDPAANLALGQSYVLHLADDGMAGDDLVRILGSYNAGPGSFARMAGAIPPTDDPLLFMESIPNEETRGFIPQALAYTWIYAARLGLPAPSLDALAAGAWPAFRAPGHHEAPPRLH